MLSNSSSAVGWSGPYFVLSHKNVEHYRSPVYDRVKKGDSSLMMVLRHRQVVCGDVMIEFFNKQKMLAKVSFRFVFLGDRTAYMRAPSSVVDSYFRQRRTRYAFVYSCVQFNKLINNPGQTHR